MERYVSRKIKMSIKDIIQPRFLHVFMILFLFIFFMYLFILQKNVIGYRTIKTFINDNIPSYIENQQKYIKKECNELCDSHICKSYEEQLYKYKMCKRCSKQGLFYHPFKGKCIKAKELKSCEEIYGCNGESPLNPFHNECQICWSKIY